MLESKSGPYQTYFGSVYGDFASSCQIVMRDHMKNKERVNQKSLKRTGNSISSTYYKIVPSLKKTRIKEFKKFVRERQPFFKGTKQWSPFCTIARLVSENKEEKVSIFIVSSF